MITAIDYPAATQQSFTRRGYFDVSVELLLGLFLAPDGTEFVGVEPGPYPGSLRFVIRHPDMDPVAEGHHLPNVEPVYEWTEVPGPARAISAVWPFVDEPVKGELRD